MKEALQFHIIVNPYFCKPTKVLLFGKSVQNFNSVLGESLAELMDKRPRIVNNDPISTVAKGAAEFSKRTLWDIRNNNQQHLYADSMTKGNQEVMDVEGA